MASPSSNTARSCGQGELKLGRARGPSWATVHPLNVPLAEVGLAFTALGGSPTRMRKCPSKGEFSILNSDLAQ